MSDRLWTALLLACTAGASAAAADGLGTPRHLYAAAIGIVLVRSGLHLGRQIESSKHRAAERALLGPDDPRRTGR